MCISWVFSKRFHGHHLLILTCHRNAISQIRTRLYDLPLQRSQPLAMRITVTAATRFWKLH